ncbi:MAG: lmo0937 family membrane protein [Kofleriaceae bacterium]
MLLILALVLGIAWVLGFTVFHVASTAIHILLVLAVIGLIAHFVRGRGGPAV